MYFDNKDFQQTYGKLVMGRDDTDEDERKKYQEYHRDVYNDGFDDLYQDL